MLTYYEVSPVKIGIIIGSHREKSESSRIGQYLSERIPSLLPGAKTYILDLAGNPLPLWDEGAWDAKEPWASIWQPLADELTACDGYLVVSPEWSGMAAPGLKNLFLLLNAKIVGHKPALIVAVSSSRGGAYPVNELRSSSYKNTRICYIPEHLIVRDCNQMFQDKEPKSEDDAYLRRRADYAISLLGQYAEALRTVRASGVINVKDYPNGM
jgi:NAD(P)H-dependent FMN reductase